MTENQPRAYVPTDAAIRTMSPERYAAWEASTPGDGGRETNPAWWEAAQAGICSHGGHGYDGDTCSDEPDGFHADEDPFAGIPNADGSEDYRPSHEVQALGNRAALDRLVPPQEFTEDNWPA